MTEFAGNKINVKEKLKFVLGRLENMWKKGENSGYHLLQTLSVTKKEINKCMAEI